MLEIRDFKGDGDNKGKIQMKNYAPEQDKKSTLNTDPGHVHQTSS